MKLKHTLLAAALASTIGYAGLSTAATTTNTFRAIITIEKSCDVSTGISDMDFGTANFQTGTPIDSQTTLTVKCTKDATYDVGLSGSGSMSNGSDTIAYALYSDAGRSTPWGNTVNTDTVAGTGDGTDQTMNVYGRVTSIPATAPAGNYNDTVTVTVTY